MFTSSFIQNQFPERIVDSLEHAKAFYGNEKWLKIDILK